uniref:M-phase phosphoprotein 8 n=1 Tax=Fundulus heteroclitus TaxID=8078 RepID=A0A3Q2QSK3_FUNHE
MEGDSDKVEPVESEQDEEEDVYEVERIIDMRVEEGEVLYRVRWKNYCSDDDTWEPEAHLEDCHEVLLAFKRHQAELKAKREQKLLPTKSDVFDADSESDSDKDLPKEEPIKKKKKKKRIREEEDESPPKEKKKKKKDKRKDELKPLPAPETDDDDEAAQTPPSSPKGSRVEPKKRFVDSDEELDDVASFKKQKKDKDREGGKHKRDKGEEGKKKKKGKKERKIDTSEDEPRPSDDPRERKERAEEGQRPSWERRTSADDRRKRKEDSEPRLFISCDENQEPPEGNDKSGKAALFVGLNPPFSCYTSSYT